MFYSARQLQQMYRTHGRVVLPYRARLTPMAQDWVKHQRVTLGYAEAALDVNAAKADAAAAADSVTMNRPPLLWWCDGPCGSVKAAIAATAKTTPLVEMPLATDPARVAAAAQVIAESVKQGTAAGGVIAVSTGAAAMLFANRCSDLRAVLGSSLAAVEAGVEGIAANVLVLEHPRLTLMQAKNMLSRFARGKPEPTEQMKRQLQALAAL